MLWKIVNLLEFAQVSNQRCDWKITRSCKLRNSWKLRQLTWHEHLNRCNPVHTIYCDEISVQHTVKCNPQDTNATSSNVTPSNEMLANVMLSNGIMFNINAIQCSVICTITQKNPRAWLHAAWVIMKLQSLWFCANFAWSRNFQKIRTSPP